MLAGHDPNTATIEANLVQVIDRQQGLARFVHLDESSVLLVEQYLHPLHITIDAYNGER